MSHHKRKRPKNTRAGCLMCKPNKMNGWPKGKLGHVGFGKLRQVIGARAAMREDTWSIGIPRMGRNIPILVIFATIVQLEERLPDEQYVPGSSPGGGTIF
jgi:hypothetical protein